MQDPIKRIRQFITRSKFITRDFITGESRTAHRFRLTLLATGLAIAVIALTLAALRDPHSRPGVAGNDRALTAASQRENIRESLYRLPLYFVENQGQIDSGIGYYVQGRDKSVYFTERGLTFILNEEDDTATGNALRPVAMGEGPQRERWAVRLDFIGANSGTRPQGYNQTDAVFSYLKGHPSRWKRGVSTYSQVVYSDLWPGIDLVYEGTVNRMKHTFVVHPGADPSRIRLAYRGATSVMVNREGQLEISTPVGGFIDQQPFSYQDIDGKRVEIATDYLMENGSPAYSFRLGEYDRSRELLIDPVTFIYTGFVGGNDEENGHDIAIDSAGNAYITGNTDSFETSFPDGDGFGALTGADTSFNLGTYDGYVVKINPAGTALLYCSYIGGDANDQGVGIVVDSAGNAYVSGVTASTEATFPDGDGFGVVGGPDLTYNGGTFDAFVAKLNPAGTTLLYCGYVGGSGRDIGERIDIDSLGNAYLVGITDSTEASFPDGDGFGALGGPDTTYNGGISDAFVAKVDSTGAALVYASYVGGSGEDIGRDIAVDGSNNAYITGETDSTEATFPDGDGFGALGGIDLTSNGGQDGFVAKVNAAGTSFVYAGYIGGSGNDQSFGIAVDSAGNAYLAGAAGSSQTTFPDGDGGLTGGPDLTFNGGTTDAFAAKLNAAGTSFAYIGYIGGANDDSASGVALDSAGNAFVIGTTGSDETTFPDGDGGLVEGPDLTYNGGSWDAFVAKVNTTGAALVYVGYIGGSNNDFGRSIAVSSAGGAFVLGQTSSTESSFPDGDGGPISGPDLTFNGGSDDAFVARISCNFGTCPANTTVSNDPGQCGAVVAFTPPTSDCQPVICSPASGSLFAVGTTTVTCSDQGGSSCSFTVTVNDTQPPTITCPANTQAGSTDGNPVAVSYPNPSALDNCPGVTSMCAPASGSLFSVGTTTVTCTATDAAGNTASCSFTVTVMLFDSCLQDDSNPGKVLLFSTTTGLYTFCCNGTTLSGTGKVTRKGNVFTLTHNTPDRRVLGKIDKLLKKGTASLQSPSGAILCTISDTNTTNNTCICAL
jgi:hypothetical protein